MSTKLSASSLTNPKTHTDSPRRSTLTLESRSSLSTSLMSQNAKMTKLMQSYQADQQLKYLHLQAEVEVLLQQLQTLKQRRLAGVTSETSLQD